MNNATKEPMSTDSSRPRNVLWTLDPDMPLRMTQGVRLPEQVVILEELQSAPLPVKAAPPAGRQAFLLFCLLLTSVLAYLVFTGRVTF